MSDPTKLDLLLAVQALYDEMPHWRIFARWEARRYREGLLRDLATDPPLERRPGEAPLLRGL